MQVIFYSFSKRHNSIKRPTATGTARTCVLKDTCSIVSPSFEINWDNSDPSAYVYCFVPLWGSYYYISDWTYTGRTWVASCVRDAMATFRGDINNSTLYVLRSQSTYNNNIYDNTYPATVEQHHSVNYINTNWAVDSMSGGCFIVGVVGWNSTLASGIVYYILDAEEFALLRNFVFSNTPEYKNTGNAMLWGDLSALDYADSKITNIMNMFDYIVSVMWLPFFPSSSQTTEIHIAYWGSGIIGRVLSKSQYYQSFDIPIPKHPLASSRGNWLKCSPFSRYTLFTSTFGAISIDGAELEDNTNLHCEITCDVITGAGGLRLSGDLTGYFAQYTGQIGVSQLMAGAKTTGLAGAVDGGATIGGTLASAFMGNQLSISGIQNGIDSIFSTLAPKSSVSGSQGTGALFSQTWVLELEYYNPVDENIANRGRPLCERRQIGTLSGFCQVSDGNINTTATPDEKAQIKNYLEGGFYIE